jgi:hypothetical protein
LPLLQHLLTVQNFLVSSCEIIKIFRCPGSASCLQLDLSSAFLLKYRYAQYFLLLVRWNVGFRSIVYRLQCASCLRAIMSSYLKSALVNLVLFWDTQRM